MREKRYRNNKNKTLSISDQMSKNFIAKMKKTGFEKRYAEKLEGKDLGIFYRKIKEGYKKRVITKTITEKEYYLLIVDRLEGKGRVASSKNQKRTVNRNS